MIAVRLRRYGSWLCKESAPALGCAVGHKLWERCKGRPGVFVTLTYDREPYEDALDLYRTQSERKHVAKFMTRLSKRLGRSLKGKWVRKMEFQEGGWVHWHLIILDEKFISNALLSECWKHGFTKTKSLSKERCRYLTKYVTKGGVPLPAFIWGERPRSVKIIAASPGFWGREPKPSNYCPIYAKYGPQPPQRIPGYVPIGVKLKLARGVTIGKGNPGQRPYAIRSISCEPYQFLSLICRDARSCTQANGWMWVDVEEELAEKAAAACRREWSQRLGGGKPAPRSGALNLRGTSNRAWEEIWRPDWLDDWWRQEAMANWLPGVTA